MMRQIEFATFQPDKSFPIGRIYGPVSPEKTLIVREQQTYYVGEEECFIIVPRDANGQYMFVDNVPDTHPFKVKIFPEVHEIKTYPCLDSDGKLFVKVDITLLEVGEYNVQVILDWYGIIEKPFTIVANGFDETLLSFINEYPPEREAPLKPDIISGHGHGDEEINRAWGVCALPDGLFAVGDRGNNQVKVFGTSQRVIDIYPRNTILPSGERGLFNKPCGVAYTNTPEAAVVVADKDNHRIAILLWDAKNRKLKYDRAFGREGKDIGQLNYPWDVAVNMRGEIAVSDSRNWRVQLFSFCGDFIATFGFGNEPDDLKASCFTPTKPLNYPRGVVFDRTGNLLVTDFNMHSVTIVNSDFNQSMKFGRCIRSALERRDSDESFDSTHDSSDDEEIDQIIMERPTGIAIDKYGNFYVAVCKRREIYVFNPDRTLRGKIRHAEILKPAGICITTEGRLVVIEEGENDKISSIADLHRILVF